MPRENSKAEPGTSGPHKEDEKDGKKMAGGTDTESAGGQVPKEGVSKVNESGKGSGNR